jgi:hypothetical protein
MYEVRQKRQHLRTREAQKIGRFLTDHLIPVILGPENRHYIIDHHHLALDLFSEAAVRARKSPQTDTA